MKISKLPSTVIIAILCAACYYEPDNPTNGTLEITSTNDCIVRMLTADSIQIASEYYEVGRTPIFFRMNGTGDYIIQAVSGSRIYEQPYIYSGGHKSYYIEF